MEISYEQEHKKIRIHQKRYALELISRFGLDQSKKMVEVPVPVGWKPQENSQVLTGAKLSEYRAMVGSLMYLATQTRPDLCYLLHILCKGLQRPTRCLQGLAKSGIYYLKNTHDWGLEYGRQDMLRGYSDADFAGDPMTRRSLSGYCFTMNGGAIVAGAKQQSCVAQSSCESEFVALSVTCTEALWLKQLLEDLDSWDPDTPVIIYGDNSCANQLAKDPIQHSKCKHIDRRYKHIRDEVMKRRVGIAKIESRLNLADMFTKPLSRARFRSLARRLLGMPPEDKAVKWTPSL
eukprot:scaffold7580_cov901-Prasinococcus_capsulatus_cf.AAC.1